MKKLLLSLSLLLGLNFLPAQTTVQYIDPASLPLLSPGELMTDCELIETTVLDVHPGTYHYKAFDVAYSWLFPIENHKLNLESQNGQEEHFSFGLIADCQYCAVEGTGVRKYSISDQKLQKCVTHLNTLDLEYVVHLGDFIDRDYESFAVVGPIYKQLKMPAYHVLGNHDFSVADKKKKKVVKTMGLSSRYYDFEVQGWRFVVLDGNDVSFHAYPENSKKFREAEAYYETHQIESPRWNGAIGEEQMNWIEKTLQKACEAEEKVVFYCHFPVYPDNIHNLWNAPEVVALIEQYDCVKAYVNGHNHQGNYAAKAGIHYLTLKGMVDTEETSYATMKVWPDRLELTGFGRQGNRVMVIRK